MEIRDLVHGVIRVGSDELPILDAYPFQRLRQIKQMGFAEHSYPGATHTRYIHSIGAMNTATQMFDAIFKSPSKSVLRFRPLVRLAALLHDIGHGPLSHTTEFAMPPVNDLKVPGLKKSDRIATHEDYTLKIILDSELTPLLAENGKKYGFKPIHIAALIEPSFHPKDDFFTIPDGGHAIDYHPLLSQLISSELDADRMDYLRRDATHSGVSYGIFDADWIISNLTSTTQKGKCYLALKHRALYAFEDFLLSRFHMFLMVYLHHKTVGYDEMLAKYLNDPGCTYKLPADINAYLRVTDAHLYQHLLDSPHPFARRIVEKRPYRLLLETHSGIPSTQTAAEKQSRLFKKTLEELRHKKIDFIESESKGELSKYFQKAAHPIYVKYDNLYTKPEFIPLQDCTALFSRYPTTRSISRIFVRPEDFERVRGIARSSELFSDQA